MLKSCTPAAERKEAGAGFRVLLIGNYPPDRQESMQRFSRALQRGLEEAGVEVELIRPKPVFGRWAKWLPAGCAKWLGYVDKFLVFPRRLRRALAAHGRAVVHVCDHSNAFYVHHLQTVAHVVTCHDLLAVRSALGEIPENATRWSGRRLQGIILRGLNGARRVVCVSHATKGEVGRLTRLRPEQVSVVANAANPVYTPLPTGPARALAGEVCRRAAGWEPAGFLLHVGGNVWYKNRLGVLRILAALDETPLCLVMVGEPLTEEMTAFIVQHGLQQRVLRVPSCSDEELRALYATAEALVFPSLAEGFGWPVIEAQAAGCPVVCSDAGPLPEVAGGGALICPAGDAAAWTSAILRLANPAERASWIARGLANAAQYTTQRMIEGYLSVYREVWADQVAVEAGHAVDGVPSAAALRT